jgi:hypothetical protein
MSVARVFRARIVSGPEKEFEELFETVSSQSAGSIITIRGRRASHHGTTGSRFADRGLRFESGKSVAQTGAQGRPHAGRVHIRRREVQNRDVQGGS